MFMDDDEFDVDIDVFMVDNYELLLEVNVA